MLNAIRAILSSWRGRISVAFVLLVAIGEAFSPLTNHVGYASALVAAVITSFVAAITAAGAPARWRDRAIRVSPGEALGSVGSLAVGFVALMMSVAGIAGILGHPCTPARGAAFYALLSLPSAVLASFLGLAFGAATRRRAIATTLAALLVPAFIAWTAVRFYRAPTIFAYDPFFGFFPGTLYDETIPLTATLVTYRLGTLGWIVALGGAIAAFWRDESRSLEVRSPVLTPAILVAIGGLFVGLTVYLVGSTLGHRHDAEDIARILGGRVDGRRCSVVYARTIPGREARLMRDDCEVRIAQLEGFFGVHVDHRVTVFLFSDAAQKQQLMGAADTYIAKPWRNEVYLQYAPFPHPVLEHELAHVVAGAMSPGPFHVSARARVLPLPGLIEGAAVAAAWDGEGDASPHQWSRAMLDAGLAPPMRAITGLGFFLHASGTAYTLAGSFSRWLIETRGASRYRALYAGDSFESVYGHGIDELERDWHAFLRTVSVPDRILARARVRFRRASLFARTCPHETAEMLDRATAHLAAGDVSHARTELTTVVANDPTDVLARAHLAEAWARSGDIARATEIVQNAQRELGPAAAVRLRSRVGDVVWRWQGPVAARAFYADIDPDWFDEDDARTVEVKRWALGLGPVPADFEYTVAVQDLLVGRGDVDQDALAMTARLALRFHPGGRDAPPEPMAAYLIGRQLEGHDRHRDAVDVLASIDGGGLITTRVRREAVRLEAVARFLGGDAASALPIFERLANDPESPQGVRDIAADWLDRARRAVAR